MFESLITKFLMDYAAKIVINLGTAAMATGYVTHDQTTAITGGLVAAIAAAITAGFKIANTKAALIVKK